MFQFTPAAAPAGSTMPRRQLEDWSPRRAVGDDRVLRQTRTCFFRYRATDCAAAAPLRGDECDAVDDGQLAAAAVARAKASTCLSAMIRSRPRLHEQGRRRALGRVPHRRQIFKRREARELLGTSRRWSPARNPTGCRRVEINQCVGCTRQFFTKSRRVNNGPMGDRRSHAFAGASRRWRGGRGMIQHERP